MGSVGLGDGRRCLIAAGSISEKSGRERNTVPSPGVVSGPPQGGAVALVHAGKDHTSLCAGAFASTPWAAFVQVVPETTVIVRGVTIVVGPGAGTADQDQTSHPPGRHHPVHSVILTAVATHPLLTHRAPASAALRQ